MFRFNSLFETFVSKKNDKMQNKLINVFSCSTPMRGIQILSLSNSSLFKQKRHDIISKLQETKLSSCFWKNTQDLQTLNISARVRGFTTVVSEENTSPSNNQFVNPLNLNVDSIEFKERLRAAQEDADRFPDNSKLQADYLQLLNVVNPSGVIKRMKGNASFAMNEAVRKEYMKALLKTGEFDQFPIDSILKSDKRDQPGSTTANPVFIKMTTSWHSYVASGVMVVILGLSLYMLFFRGVGIDNMLGKQQMLSPAERTNTTFDDVKGADEAKQELQDIVEYLKHPAKFSRLDAKLPKGVLLVGPPGCGKTLVARALAGEAGVPFFFTSGSEFEEMFVGVGASRVRKLFEKAKQNAPCVIFLDEIDAIGGRRDSPDARYHKMTLNQLLVELDGFEQHTGIIVVAATNLPDILDPAITRPGRFDRIVTIPLPDVKARKDILGLYLAGRGAVDVNLESLARSTTGFSGAEIFNMVNIAAIDATKRNLTKIPMHLIEAAKDHVIMGPERKAMVISPETKRLTAYHESGHAIVGLYTPGENEIVKATLVPRGSALGMVAWQPKDELLPTKEAYLARIDSAMGGRVAEELIFGSNKVTPGAGSDFQQATNIARQMVMQFGMGEKIGKMAFSDVDIKYNRISSETQHLIEVEVKEILEKSYNRAKDLLTKHRHELHLLANALLEYETLTLSEIKMVLTGKDIKTHIQKKKQEEIDLIAKEEELYGIDKNSTEEIEDLQPSMIVENPQKDTKEEKEKSKKSVLLQEKK